MDDLTPRGPYLPSKLTGDSSLRAECRRRGLPALSWRFTEIFRLGGADAGPEAFNRINHRGTAVGPDGRIYVLDYGNHRVVSFSAYGGDSRSFGRKGGGPGEIGNPAALAVAEGGTVSVLDYGKNGLTRFGPDGSALESEPIELFYQVGDIGHHAGGLLLQRLEGYRTDGSYVYDRLQLRKLDGSLTNLASVRRARPAMVQYTGCVAAPLDPLFAPRLSWDANADRVATNSIPEYVVDIWEGGRATASYRRAIPLHSITREDALAELGEGTTVTTPGGKCDIDPEEELEGRGFADVLPAIGRLTVAPDGSIWVRRRSLRGDPRLIDILDPEGHYWGTLPPGSPFPYAFLAPDTIVLERRDDLDLEYLVAYAVEMQSDQ